MRWELLLKRLALDTSRACHPSVTLSDRITFIPRTMLLHFFCESGLFFRLCAWLGVLCSLSGRRGVWWPSPLTGRLAWPSLCLFPNGFALVLLLDTFLLAASSFHWIATLPKVHSGEFGGVPMDPRPSRAHFSYFNTASYVTLIKLLFSRACDPLHQNRSWLCKQRGYIFNSVFMRVIIVFLSHFLRDCGKRRPFFSKPNTGEISFAIPFVT